jgi:NAD(P)-dependent dehydrogenase (short-subunit alcohol dehydrogenase family)
MGVLAGRVALVTGASRGIGRAVAKCFADQGAEVVAVARDAAALETLEGCKTFAADLAELSAVERLAGLIDSEFGRLDILIANAALFPSHSLVHEIPLAEMRRTFELNFFSNWYLLPRLHSLLMKSDAARVVFVTAKGVYWGDPEWSAYSASKAALDRIMAAYATENEATHIRCNSLSPGPVLTDMAVHAMKGDTEGMVAPEAILPLFLHLMSPDLRETGRMFDYRHEKETIEPWQEFIRR